MRGTLTWLLGLGSQQFCRFLALRQVVQIGNLEGDLYRRCVLACCHAWNAIEGTDLSWSPEDFRKHLQKEPFPSPISARLVRYLPKYKTQRCSLSRDLWLRFPQLKNWSEQIGLIALATQTLLSHNQCTGTKGNSTDSELFREPETLSWL